MKVNYFIRQVVMRVEAVMLMRFTVQIPAIALVVVNMGLLIKGMKVLQEEGVV